MNTLKLRLINGSSTQMMWKIDGKELPVKKGKNGVAEIVYTTDKPSVKLSVHTYLALKGKAWWLSSLLFFILSVFGLFDKRGQEKHRAIAYEGEIPVQESTQATVRVLRFRENEKGVAIDGVEAVETENRCYVDTVAKKRGKVLIALKIVVLAVTVVGVALLVI